MPSVRVFGQHRWLRYAVLAGAVCVLGAVTVFATRKKAGSDGDQFMPAVVVQKPQVGSLSQSVTLNGYVEAEAMIPVVPFVQGTIVAYDVRAGDYVEKDAVLARIDDAPFMQQLLQAQAAYFAAKSTFDRIESLYRQGATSQQNYDSAKAQSDASKAQYDLAQLQYDYTQVKASVAGTVLVADLAVGSIATGSEPVAVIADLQSQVVRLAVPEKYFDLFALRRDDLVVTVTRPAQDGLYDDAVTGATILTIAPYISAESKNFQVLCKLDAPGERFRPGMFVTVSVAYASYDNVPLLPLTARKLDGSCYAYDQESGRAVYVSLDAEPPSDGTWFVLPAQYADTYFITDGHNSVFDGQQVTVVDGGLFETF